MANNNEYKLLLSAYIDEKSVNDQIDNISKNKIFNIKIKFDLTDVKKQITDLKKQLEGLDTKIGGASRGGRNAPSFGRSSTAKVKIVDAETELMALDKIQKRLREIQSTATKEARVDVTQKDGEITRAVYTYTDKAGRSVKETWIPAVEEVNGKLQKTGMLAKDVVKATDNIAQRERQAAKDAEKLAAHYQKIKNLSDTFLEKSKPLSKSNSLVSEGIGISNQIGALLGGNKPLTDDQNKQLDELYNRLKVVDGAVRASGKNLQSWSTEMNIAIQRTIEWATSIGLVYGAINQLRQGIQYIRELDKEMTNIQAVSGATKEEVYDLAQNYNELAKSLKVSTLEVARGSLEYIRQGKSLKETEELLKSTTILSKLGNTDMAQSTEYLTSIMNAYKLDVEDTMSVVDRLVSVDNAASTSVQELASAMQRTAVTAQQTGVDMNSLIAYIGTVSAVSRKSSESIGESLFHTIVYLN